MLGVFAKFERATIIDRVIAGMPSAAAFPQDPELLSAADAGLAVWHAVLDLATRLATNCANAYRAADQKIKGQFNEAVFDHIVVTRGRIAEAHYKPPFGVLFLPEFEHSTHRAHRSRMLGVGKQADLGAIRRRQFEAGLHNLPQTSGRVRLLFQLFDSLARSDFAPTYQARLGSGHPGSCSANRSCLW